MGLRLHVVAGVLQRDGQVLIARRPEGKHGAGYWEFPGGKVEPGECLSTALRRVLFEELGIQIGATQPLSVVHHDYAERSVKLNFQRVLDWHGTPRPLESQEIRWVALDALDAIEFLPANRDVVQSLKRVEC